MSVAQFSNVVHVTCNLQPVTSQKANRPMGFQKWDDYFGFVSNLLRSRITEN